MDWKMLFLSADGRIGRQSFWIGWLILLVVGVVLSAIPVLGWLLNIVCIYATVCIFSKRLHDMGRSGWLQVWPMVINFALLFASLFSMGGPAAMTAMKGGPDGAIAAAALGGIGVGLLLLLLVFAVGLAFLLWVGLTPSDPQTNRYGPAPNDPATVL